MASFGPERGRGVVIGRRTVLATALAMAGAPLHAGRLAELIGTAKSSVCPVGTYNLLDNPRFGFRGTGFFLGDGSVVATCWHVIADATKGDRPGLTTLAVLVQSGDGTSEVVLAELGHVDRTHDLALLRVGKAAGRPLELATGATEREGADVALIGFPIGGVLGFRPVTHRGIVASVVASALPVANTRQLDEAAVGRLRLGSFELLQLDATAYPGNSGGPLLSVETGQVVGVVNMVLVKAGRESALSQPTGITYAIPVRYLAELLDRT